MSTVHAMPMDVLSTVAESGKPLSPHNAKKKADLHPPNLDVTSVVRLRPGNVKGVVADASAASQVKKKKQSKDEAAHDLGQETVVIDK